MIILFQEGIQSQLMTSVILNLSNTCLLPREVFRFGLICKKDGKFSDNDFYCQIESKDFGTITNTSYSETHSSVYIFTHSSYSIDSNVIKKF